MDEFIAMIAIERREEYQNESLPANISCMRFVGSARAPFVVMTTADNKRADTLYIYEICIRITRKMLQHGEHGEGERYYRLGALIRRCR